MKVDHLKRSDDCSVTYEDHNTIIFLAKECEEVESRFILSDDDTTSLANNQLVHDQYSSVVTLASGTTSSSQHGNKMKSSLGEGIEENVDGFQSPTKVITDVILSASLKCPHAPRKPKATPLGKRKGKSRNDLHVEFANEVELVLRILSSEVDDTKLKRARLLAAGEMRMEDQ